MLFDRQTDPGYHDVETGNPHLRKRLNTKPMPENEIKLLNLMKIIVESQWTIDESVYSDMMKFAGYPALIEEYFNRLDAKKLADQRELQVLRASKDSEKKLEQFESYKDLLITETELE